MRNLNLGVLALFLLASPASPEVSSGEKCFDERSTSTYTRTIQPMFDVYCVACHQDRSAAAGLSLQSGGSAKALPYMVSGQNGGRLFVAGDPEASYLYRKLLDTHREAGGGGDRMPLSGIMSGENQAIVQAWIRSCSTED